MSYTSHLELALPDLGRAVAARFTNPAVIGDFALLQEWAAQAAEQLNPFTVWLRVCDHLKHILANIGPPKFPQFLKNHAHGISNCGFWIIVTISRHPH